VGVDARGSGLQREPSGAMVASPGFRRVEQRLTYAAGSAVWRHGEILDPGSLPEPYRDDVEIDRREPEECLVVVRNQDGRTIVRYGRLDPISRDGRRPVRRPYTWRREKPVVSSRDCRPLARSCVPDDASNSAIRCGLVQ
jgi:hypothetical protein